ncbi:MAG: hypothetical protein Q7S53_03045 [bacterium]|nr:hypothetical protein [bacterium]
MGTMMIVAEAAVLINGEPCEACGKAVAVFFALLFALLFGAAVLGAAMFGFPGTQKDNDEE